MVKPCYQSLSSKARLDTHTQSGGYSVYSETDCTIREDPGGRMGEGCWGKRDAVGQRHEARVWTAAPTVMAGFCSVC